MKVLQVTTNYPTIKYPAFGIFVKEQIESIEKLGVVNTIFYSNGKENGGIKEHLRSIFRLFVHLFKNRYDVIHCHHVISAMILFLSGGCFFNSCILSYQNDPDREMGKIIFWILYPFFDKIIVKNDSKYLHYRKVVYLPNGCNSDFFRPMDRVECRKQLGLDLNDIYILYMDSNKGKRIQKRKDRFDAVLLMLKDEYGLKNVKAIELYNTPRDIIPLYINSCNLHLMTSDFEGSPNSVKECLCCNVPIVSTNVGNIKLMVYDIPGCFVIDSFSIKELSDACYKVLTSNILFKGRDLFLSKGLGINVVAEHLLQLYNSLR